MEQKHNTGWEKGVQRWGAWREISLEGPHRRKEGGKKPKTNQTNKIQQKTQEEDRDRIIHTWKRIQTKSSKK